MQFGLESLGRWTDPVETVIERDGTIAYAAATNDPMAAHLAGDQAPPIYAVVPVWGTMSTAMMDVVPSDALAFVVHGEQDMRFHRPITPGLTLLKAISSAGDFSEFGDKTEVTITRVGDRKEVVDCKKALKDPKLDRPLFPGDRIYVPRRFF